MYQYNVYSDGKFIDIVNFKKKLTEEQAKRRLVHQDNYPDDIIVQEVVNAY